MARKTTKRQEGTAAGRASSAHAVGLLIFVSGAVLMALEIAGSRVLAPWFGGSVFVWGSLIGIFLGAMSGGYWLGGWLSQRWPTQMLLNALLAAAGGFTLLLPLWAAPLCAALADLGPRLGPLTAAQYLAFLPDGQAWPALQEWVRLLAGPTLRWDAQLVLAANERPEPRLGRVVQLGLTAWLGRGTARRNPSRQHLRLRPKPVLSPRQGGGPDA